MKYQNKINIKQKKGSVLAYVLVIMSVTSILLVSILQYISSQVKYGSFNYSREESFQIAEAGINFYKWYLAKEMETRTTPQDIQDFWANGNTIGTEYTCEDAGAYIVDYEAGEVSGKYCIEVTPPDEWSTIFTVKVSGWTNKKPEVKRTIQARFRRPSFSEYMIVGNQQFVLNDETVAHGRLHSNEGIHFNGVAYNVVSSEQETYYYPGELLGINSGTKPGVWTKWPSEYNSTLNSNVFRAGKQIGTDAGAVHWDFPSIDPYINFAKAESLKGINPPTTPCDANGCYFNNSGEGRHIILSGDNMTVCTADSYCTSNFCARGWDFFYYKKYSIKTYLKNSGIGTCSSCSGECASTYAIPNNGAIYVEDNIWIEGILGSSSNHKRVTAIAADMSQSPGKNIFIGRNNITYSSNNGEDMLGLLAQNNIEVMRDSQNNLTINGALMAKNGRVGRDTYLLDFPNSITFFGSIVTNGKFNVGKGVIWWLDLGYQHAYLNFDSDLLYYPPPFFPTGVGYAMDLWEEL